MTKFKIKPLTITLMSLGVMIAVPTVFASTSTTTGSTPSQKSTVMTKAEDNAVLQKLSNKDGLSPKLLKMGLNAYHYAQEHGGVKRKVLTIVNLSAPSKNKRLWVINLNNNTIEAHTLVANGKNSGLYKAVRFSNRPGSLESSVGVYRTGGTFYGNDSYSMRLHGLEKGINNNAYRRDIVMHPAWYVSPKFAQEYGRVGRSWGCFALDKHIAPKIINMVKDGSVLFTYGTPENHDPAVNSGVYSL